MKSLPLVALSIFALGCASADPFRRPVPAPLRPNPIYTAQGTGAGCEDSREEAEEDSLRVALPSSPLPASGWGAVGMIPADPEMVLLCPCGCGGWAGALDRRGSGVFLWVWKRSRGGGLR